MSFHTASSTERKGGLPTRPADVFLSGITGMQMAKLTYREQLLHPNWQRKRLEMLEKAQWTCGNCGETEATLHVHHRRYVKGRMVWDYDEEELEVLCDSCHAEHHAHRELLDRILADAASFGASTAEAVGLLGGYFAANVAIGPELQREAIAIDGHSHDLGVLAALASGEQWSVLAKAADVMGRKAHSPAEREAIERWKSGAS